jgi:Cof subfamily protein (haloacid dehalogenase superfamily)
VNQLLDIRAAGAPRPARPIRAAVLDLDGTCLDQQQRLHPRLRDAVRSAAQRLPVIVATGRMYVSALPWVRELGVREPVVCYEGAVVRAMPEDGEVIGALIYEDVLEAGPAIRALHVARQHRWYFQVYADEQLLCEEQRPEADMYARVAGVPLKKVDDLEPWLAQGTPKAVCVVTDPIEIALCIQTMTQQLAGAARVTQSRTEYVEIVNPAVSKAVACALVCDRIGVDMHDVLAVGDAPNDIELLDAAGFAVAVAGARQDVLEHADVVCASPEEAGVADALEALGLS